MPAVADRGDAGPAVRSPSGAGGQHRDPSFGYVGVRRQPAGTGRRRIGPGGLRRAGRLRELVATGLIDSFGMSLGWTVLVLLGLARGGIVEAGLYNAAMLVGVVLSAPVAGWLARRFAGRTLLRGAGAVELLLRVGLLWGAVQGLPAPVVAAGITVMHVAAWVGFAAMRAEVTAVDRRAPAMTRYAVAIASVEAAGTGLAALLPVGPHGHPTGWVLITVIAVYGGSLLPTISSARRARVRTQAPAVARRFAVVPHGLQSSGGRLLLGGCITLLASGPTLLAVPLTTELHSRYWVVGSAVAFSAGCLLSSAAIRAVDRFALPTALRWTMWGVVMLSGWAAATVSPLAVLLAQILAGLALTAFEGDMDAEVAERAAGTSITEALAYSAATRALGSAVAVRALPALVTAPAIGTASVTAATVLAVAATAWAATQRRPGRRMATRPG